MRIEEFDVEKAWWENREETEYAWKVSVGTIAANGYNLDIKNPNAIAASHEDPLVLLKQYQEAAAMADQARLALKTGLQVCLEHSTGAKP
jgi:type I restriction enzyme M protein